MQIIKDYRIEGQARDTTIVQLVHRHGVITSDLVQLALSRERFDLPGESRAAVLNRLTILANRGYFHRLGRSHSGHIVYGTRRPRKRAQPQLEHSLIGARFGTHIDLASIDRCITITDLVSDQTELRLLARKEGWQFVPDRIFTLAGVRYFCEFDNSTESDDKILAKVEAYKGFIRRKRQRREMLEKLGERVNSFIRVLWMTTTEKRAEKLAEMMEGNLHWLTYEKAYLGKPEMVLAPIWKTGRTSDETLHHLLETRERPEA